MYLLNITRQVQWYITTQKVCWQRQSGLWKEHFLFLGHDQGSISQASLVRLSGTAVQIQVLATQI
jgi:hypothetical protein